MKGSSIVLDDDKDRKEYKSAEDIENDIAQMNI